MLDKTYSSDEKGKIKLSEGEVEIKTSIDDLMPDDEIQTNAPYEEEYAPIFEKGDEIDLGVYIVDARSGYELKDFIGKVTYKSSDESVATVDAKGHVTFAGEGNVKITIKMGKSAYFKKCKRIIEL